MCVLGLGDISMMRESDLLILFSSMLKISCQPSNTSLRPLRNPDNSIRINPPHHTPSPNTPASIVVGPIRRGMGRCVERLWVCDEALSGEGARG